MKQNGRRRLTTDEIALMRAIVLWRRELVKGWPRGQYYRRAWTLGLLDDRVQVAFEPPNSNWEDDDATATLFYCRGQYVSFDQVEVRSLTEAVGVLVALGYLPARFSPAYRAGWEACIDSEGTGVAEAEVVVLPTCPIGLADTLDM